MGVRRASFRRFRIRTLPHRRRRGDRALLRIGRTARCRSPLRFRASACAPRTNRFAPCSSRVARLSGANIAVGGEVSGYVTVELHRFRWHRHLGRSSYRSGRCITFATGCMMSSAVPCAPTRTQADGARSIAGHRRLRETCRSDIGGALSAGFDPHGRARERARRGRCSGRRSGDARVLQGIDVRNPSQPTTEALPLRIAHSAVLLQNLRSAFPAAKFAAAGEKQLLITATPNDMTQMSRRSRRSTHRRSSRRRRRRPPRRFG